MEKSRPKACEQLRAHFDRKREANPAFSLRNFASRLKLSPAFVSNVLGGKRELPLARARDFARLLGMDAYATRRLVRSLVLEQDLDPATRLDVDLDPEELAPGGLGELPSESYEQAAPKNHSVLEHWYYLPMLDLVDTGGFRAEAAWIASRLGLREEVASEAWKRLVAMECVRQDTAGRWRKQAGKILFPAARTDALIQKYHLAMLEKSAEELRVHREEQHFQKRLMMSVSVSANPENVQKAKRYLEEALIRAADILNEGEGTEVFHLGIQCFPLTREES